MAKDRSEIASFLVLVIARGRCVSSHLSGRVVTDALTEKAWEDTVQGLGKKRTNKEIISWTNHSGGYINNFFYCQHSFGRCGNA